MRSKNLRAEDKLLIIGQAGGTHVGGSFMRAAKILGIEAEFLSSDQAFGGVYFLRAASRHLLGKRPLYLRSFSREVLSLGDIYKPKWIVTTGFAPLDTDTLKRIGRMGIKRINFLTDDPWNSNNYARWIMEALPEYDEIFTPRRSNINDLKDLGCGKVKYLPFGYDPDLFYSEGLSERQQIKYSSDVVFAGGADSDRIPYLKALVKAGMNVALYGGRWERYKETRRITMGRIDVPSLRRAISLSKIGLCLVRRANRDGSCMRTFEVPAVGGACMLTEDTDEHREIFGEEGRAVLYFRTVDEMVFKARVLSDDGEMRNKLAAKAHDMIANGKNTYSDRLEIMLKG